MPSRRTSHNAHITHYDGAKADFVNDWWKGASKNLIVEGTTGAVRSIPRRLVAAVPGRRMVADKLDGRRYTHHQDRLRRLGLLAAVDGSPVGERKRDRARRARVLSIFRESGIFDEGRIVGIQPIIYATAYREHGSSLTRRARTLSNTIDAEKVGGETLFNPKPLLVTGRRQVETTKAIYDAAADLEEKAEAINGKDVDTYVPSPSLIIVMGAAHIARTLPGPSYDEVVRSGIVTPDLIDSLPRSDVWIPRFIPRPPVRPAVENELPAPLVAVPEPALVVARPYTEVYS